ncbi:META domain-containing protein [Stutzerimonas urumqiensis]|uniref:META domain-containing protein n=1 Tax=Stutzerimonas urumqiensis TaxID=638269 RepID=UPI003BA8DFBF
MNKPLFALLTALSLVGCAVEPTTLQEETTYFAEWVGEEPVVGRNRLSLVFGTEGRAYGNAGCNHWFGTYSLDGTQIDFSDIGSTRMACDPLIMKQENDFLDTLSRVERWDISNTDQLRLWPNEGAPLRLWPAQE